MMKLMKLMELISEITVFLLISTLSFYLTSNLLGEVLVRGRRLFQIKGNTSYQISERFCPLQQ